MNSQYHAYGAMPQQLESGISQLGKPLAHSFVPKRRERMSLKGLCACLFMPWLLFSFHYAVVTFSIHYDYPFLCWAFVGLGVLLTLAMGALAWQRSQDSKLSWHLFLFFCCCLASVAGPLLGDINYWTNMQAYYDLKTLNVYEDVNPAKSHGQQMMDAGKVTFAHGASVDHTKAFKFQDLDSYCVAPIALGKSDLKIYDFWAVGLNCCGWNATKQFDYKCGSHQSTSRQGLRLMNENQRDFFRLAVQQAEAQHKILAKHPIFFYWTDDADADMLGYYEYGFKYFQAGVGAFFVVQIFLLIVSTVIFSKLE